MSPQQIQLAQALLTNLVSVSPKTTAQGAEVKRLQEQGALEMLSHKTVEYLEREELIELLPPTQHTPILIRLTKKGQQVERRGLAAYLAAEDAREEAAYQENLAKISEQRSKNTPTAPQVKKNWLERIETIVGLVAGILAIGVSVISC